MSTPGPPPTTACPRCGASLERAQDWCLSCGAAARTRLAPAPNWRLPLAALGTVIAACVVALALAFVALTDDPDAATGATGASGASGATGVTAAPAPVPPPAAATGPSGPAATTGASGATGATGGARAAPRPLRPGATGTTGAADEP